MQKLFLATLTLSGILFSLSVNAWPKITLGEDSSVCREVGEVALATHRSTSSIRDEYAAMQLFTRDIILGPTEVDLTGGDALQADPDVIDKIRNRYSYRGNTYWQKSPHGNYRFVLHETPVGWRGDIFNLFAWPADLSIEAFWDHFEQHRNVSDVDTAFISGAWRSPLVLSADDDDQWWVFYVGPPKHYSGTWTVFSFSSNGAELVCQIEFGPDVDDTFLLLPEPVRALAELLVMTLGYDTRWGNVAPIHRIKRATQTAWAEAVLRPWVRREPYNTTAQVDRGLKAWADMDDWNRGLYEQIKAQYPVAESALALLYEEQFNHSREEARALAREVLDNIYRMHYVFPRSP